MLINDILASAISYNGNDVKRINHLIKVFSNDGMYTFLYS